MDETLKLGLKTQLEDLERRLSTKRDEVRKIREDFEAILGSAEEAEEELTQTIEDLKQSRRSLERAADAMSQYV